MVTPLQIIGYGWALAAASVPVAIVLLASYAVYCWMHTPRDEPTVPTE